MLVVITTHPIQYQVPLWKALALDLGLSFEVWFLCDHAVRATHDPEFGRKFAWDIGQGSLEGYAHRFLHINRRWSLHPSDFLGIRLVGSLEPLLREKRVKAVWIQGWQKLAYWQAARQARSAGAEVWLRGETNDLAPESVGIKGWIKRRRLGWLFARVDRFFCIGTANRRFYRRYGVADERLHWAPYCVDNARFSEQARSLRPMREEIRRSMGIPLDAYCILFCGKFIAKKRPMDLVEAATEMERAESEAAGAAGSGRPVHLLFVGSGELGGALRSRCQVVFDADRAEAPSGAADPRRGPKASFAGFMNQTEISRAYVAADVLVLPSDHGETWGLVVNEAMASGLPCLVSSAVGCAEDLVAPTGAWRVFPLGDAAALAQGLAADRSGERPDVSAQASRFDLAVTVDAVRRASQSLHA